MARRRYISTQISVDKAINQLATEGGHFAVMLYTWMIPHAGDDGRLTGDPDEILMTVIPGRRDKTTQDVTEALYWMAQCGLIEWDDQHVSFPVESFYKHQSYIKQENRRTAAQTPDITNSSDEQRLTPENAGERRESPENAVSVSPSFPVPVSSPVSVSATASDDAVAMAPAARKPRPVPKPAAKARAPDEHWDTQVEIFGFTPTRDTPEHDRWQKSTDIWRKLGASPDDMRRAAGLYRAEFPAAAFTAVALASRAEQLLKGHKPNAPPRLEDIKNPMTRAALTVDLSDITAELEAQHGSRASLPGQDRNPRELFAESRRLGTGE